jgi:hypothetical protein
VLALAAADSGSVSARPQGRGLGCFEKHQHTDHGPSRATASREFQSLDWSVQHDRFIPGPARAAYL